MLPAIYPGPVIGGNPTYLGFTLGEILYYTSSGTFAIGDYPGARALIVECVGGGGGGGGATTTAAGQLSGGGGGGSGGYARALILAADLASSETVTVGAGGSAGSGVGPVAGGTGGHSWFGQTVTTDVHCQGNGGGGGSTGSAQAGGGSFNTVAGNGGDAVAGDLLCPGTEGGVKAYTSTSTPRVGGTGAPSIFGGGPQGQNGSGNGTAGRAPGAGGSGAGNAASQGSNRAGGVGADGIVIVTVLY
jgi:hypothetical protein